MASFVRRLRKKKKVFEYLLILLEFQPDEYIVHYFKGGPSVHNARAKSELFWSESGQWWSFGLYTPYGQVPEKEKYYFVLIYINYARAALRSGGQVH